MIPIGRFGQGIHTISVLALVAAVCPTALPVLKGPACAVKLLHLGSRGSLSGFQLANGQWPDCCQTWRMGRAPGIGPSPWSAFQAFPQFETRDESKMRRMLPCVGARPEQKSDLQPGQTKVSMDSADTFGSMEGGGGSAPIGGGTGQAVESSQSPVRARRRQI